MKFLIAFALLLVQCLATQNSTMTPEQQLAAANPGAVKFFQDFDADHNGIWSQKEFMTGMSTAVQLKYLPASFNLKAQWFTLSHNNTVNITLDKFIDYAATILATPPQVSNDMSFKMQHCKELFAYRDVDKDTGLNQDEFIKTFIKKFPISQILKMWSAQPHNGPSDTMNFDTFGPLCVQTLGLPLDEKAKVEQSDPCKNSTCKHGYVCVPAPRHCNATEPCPQYQCILKLFAPKSDHNQARQIYVKCISKFNAWDINKDNFLSWNEFDNGMTFEKEHGRVNNLVNIESLWLRGEQGEKMSVLEFVHICAALREQGGMDSRNTVKEECWDVFAHFDKDNSHTLSEEEFTQGMKRAKLQGHLSSSFKIGNTWDKLPKQNKQLQPADFLDFCVSISRVEEKQLIQQANAVSVDGIVHPPLSNHTKSSNSTHQLVQ